MSCVYSVRAIVVQELRNSFALEIFCYLHEQVPVFAPRYMFIKSEFHGNRFLIDSKMAKTQPRQSVLVKVRADILPYEIFIFINHYVVRIYKSKVRFADEFIHYALNCIFPEKVVVIKMSDEFTFRQFQYFIACFWIVVEREVGFEIFILLSNSDISLTKSSVLSP